MNNHNYASILKQNDISPTIQRIGVLEYLSNNHVHPSAETVYHNLEQKTPTLSLATIYNTLNLFTNKGILKLVNAEGQEARYDINLHFHGHFQCESCHQLIDFPIDLKIIDRLIPGGYQVSEKSVLLKGVCEDCLKNNKER